MTPSVSTQNLEALVLGSVEALEVRGNLCRPALSARPIGVEISYIAVLVHDETLFQSVCDSPPQLPLSPPTAAPPKLPNDALEAQQPAVLIRFVVTG